MKIKAVIDRIENNNAVIRFKLFKGELIVPLHALPKDARKQGTVLSLSVGKDKKETEKIDSEIRQILDELQND